MGDKQGNVKTVSFSRKVSGPSPICLSAVYSVFVLVCLILCMERDTGHTNIYFEMRYDKELRTSPVLVPGAVGDKATAHFPTGGWGRLAVLNKWGHKVTLKVSVFICYNFLKAR